MFISRVVDVGRAAAAYMPINRTGCSGHSTVSASPQRAIYRDEHFSDIKEPVAVRISGGAGPLFALTECDGY